MKYVKRLKNKIVLFSTLGNIIAILTLLGVIDNVKADTWTKVIGLAISILIQVGIVNDSGE
ncbi:MAG: hypothetical protein EHM20_00105 [Alphaproteobacteria bacterium]|nr:MAG: hypothetical protein EHM20_00105 [Alphaproteobacteria bacterium]